MFILTRTLVFQNTFFPFKNTHLFFQKYLSIGFFNKITTASETFSVHPVYKCQLSSKILSNDYYRGTILNKTLLIILFY